MSIKARIRLLKLRKRMLQARIASVERRYRSLCKQYGITESKALWLTNHKAP